MSFERLPHAFAKEVLPNMDPLTFDHVRQSYGRCIAQLGFFDRFYELFLASSDRIPEMFKNTDFVKQKDLLKEGIALVVMFAKNETSPLVKGKLQHIGTRHSRGDLNITEDMYPLWIESLIHTIREYDGKFTPQLEEEWRQVMVPAIEYLKALH